MIIIIIIIIIIFIIITFDAFLMPLYLFNVIRTHHWPAGPFNIKHMNYKLELISENSKFCSHIVNIHLYSFCMSQCEPVSHRDFAQKRENLN